MSEESKESVISITQGMRGYFCVLMWWNKEDGGFWEPWTSSDMSYATKAEAIPEAKEWAEAEGIKFEE